MVVLSMALLVMECYSRRLGMCLDKFGSCLGKHLIGLDKQAVLEFRALCQAAHV